MIEWYLVMILLNPANGFAEVNVVKSYNNPMACELDRDKMGFDMAEAYPYAEGDQAFLIGCLRRSKGKEV